MALHDHHMQFTLDAGDDNNNDVCGLCRHRFL